MNVVGWSWKGRSQIESRLTAAFAFVFRESTMSITDVQVRFLSPDIALAHGPLDHGWCKHPARHTPRRNPASDPEEVCGQMVDCQLSEYQQRTGAAVPNWSHRAGSFLNSEALIVVFTGEDLMVTQAGSMSVRGPQLWPRLATCVAGSAIVWVVAVGAALWYLRRTLDEDVLSSAPTDADSIGLPFASFAILLAGVLLLANLVVAVILFRRRRTQSRSPSHPAA